MKNRTVVRSLLRPLTSVLAVAALFMALAPAARATVTNLSYWRMGESEGAVQGVAYSTTDPIGGRTMTLYSVPFYDYGVSAAAAARVGSALCMWFFTGTYGTSALIPSLTDNFGIELWVKPGSTSAGNQCLVYNGNTNNSGWGLYLIGNQYRGLFGGVNFVGSATATAGTWTHLALVRASGTATLYVNGVAAGTLGSAPNAPTGIFAAASQPQNLSLDHLANGYLDEVRVFSFAPGTFSTGDLLVNLHQVATTADSGSGSLRQAVLDVNAAAVPATISFLPSLSGQTITLTSGPITLANSVTIEASSLPGGISLSGNNASRVLEVAAGTTVSLTALTIQHGAAPGDFGGGIRNLGTLTLGNCTLMTNSANNGGAIHNGSGGILTINACTFAGNSAVTAGGGVNSQATATVTESTFSGNSAGGAAGGGAINSTAASTSFTLDSCTIFGNRATGTAAGGGIRRAGGTVMITNCIVAGNTAAVAGTENLSGTITIAGPNLTSGTPLLAPLGNYGGPTQTMPPLAGSPAIDGCTAGTGFTTDQRGFPRVVGAYADIGAVELGLTFTDVAATAFPAGAPPGFYNGSAAWGDYDSDGRLDFLLTGAVNDTNIITQLWRNTGSGFSNVTVSAFPGGVPPGVSYSSVAWGDYDNDSRLDFLLTGSGFSQLWRNNGNGTFSNVTATAFPPSALPGVHRGFAAWGDYDNDGRLDFLLTGGRGVITSSVAQLWRNTGNGFTNVPLPNLLGVIYSSVAWADYDNDGRLDFLLTGADTASQFVSQLWRNTGNGFTNVTATIFPAGAPPGVGYGSLAWGDYDNDGRLDFLLTGTTNGSYLGVISQLWKNGDGGFTNVTASAFPAAPLPVEWGFAVWGDYDNDGRLDFLLSGYNGFSITSQLWRNTGSGFSNATASAFPAGAPRAVTGAVAWGDYDNDGRLDLLLSGNGLFQLWKNSTLFTNTPPGAPTGLVMTADAGGLLLSWNSATDDQTPSSGLTYNVRAGTTPGGTDLFAAQVNAANGFRRVPAMGNACLRHSLRLTGLPYGRTVYWSVQAVDSAFAGGPFASETNFLSPTFGDVSGIAFPAGDLPGVLRGSVVWGDYDNDGRLDFFLTGSETNYQTISQLWRNTGSAFTNVTATAFPAGAPPGVTDGSVAWGDYDNDSRLDFLLTGVNLGGTRYSQLWRNNGDGTFSNLTGAAFPASDLLGVSDSSVAWDDYDNDGRLDFLLTGLSSNGSVSQLWRNTGSGFTNVTASVAPGLPGVFDGSVAWTDYDNDGHFDFLLTGAGSNSGNYSQLWRNTGNRFTNVTTTEFPAGLPGVRDGSVAWGDYDNDGRLDFLLTGGADPRDYSQLWRNTGNGFTNVTATEFPAGLLAVHRSSVAWGDYDNDGRLDFLLTGSDYYNQVIVSQLWRNTGSGFTDVTASVAPGLPGVEWGSMAWGDYDNDGRLDLLLTGWTGITGTDFISRLWKNYTPVTNAPPGAPTGLAMTPSGNAGILSWNSATDDHTPASGLTYNVRAGTTPGGTDLLAAHVNATTGFRRVPAMGNAYLHHNLSLTGLPNGGTVYWSVQAVDSAFAGGPFAVESNFSVPPALTIYRQGNSAVLSWPLSAADYSLVRATNLTTSSATWPVLALPRQTNGNTISVSAPLGSAVNFFQLKK